MLAPDGAFLIGAPDTVAAKMLRIGADLDGVARLSLQMTNVRLAHDNLLRGIELLGTRVAPAVRAALPP
jgi:alkanesulfonate monooxygenase SsuD/methylene tetrahydromethanopterin reductase-like flavin-dependent oxidoreductase (luciferase family)